MILVVILEEISIKNTSCLVMWSNRPAVSTGALASKYKSAFSYGPHFGKYIYAWLVFSPFISMCMAPSLGSSLLFVEYTITELGGTGLNSRPVDEDSWMTDDSWITPGPLERVTWILCLFPRRRQSAGIQRRKYRIRRGRLLSLWWLSLSPFKILNTEKLLCLERRRWSRIHW